MALPAGERGGDDEIMTKHITVGYDGTQPSAEAVLWAADQAESRGAALRIVSCYQIPATGAPMTGYFFGEAIESLAETARQMVVSIGATVSKSHPDVVVSTDVAAGAASSALLDGLRPDDLLVVGASSHNGAAAFWLGNTPRALVRHSPCPVAVVRGPASRGRPERVVVGVDGSPAALHALDWAGDEADRQRAELVVVHGWSYPYLEVDASARQGRDLTEVDAACTLERAVEYASDRYVSAPTPVLVEASASSALLETVRDGDLLVLGSRGRGALSSSIFGSTVNTVLERSAVPVVVIRQHDEHQPAAGRQEE